ncbi:XRE family transcriptional regulator [Tsuneonella mangrovi]|uniref:XRE family transcriptional regulator n=1 Tax=Tsuneonella mangrovi TaxID=1982042 RepID=UPI000BA25FD9|nr:XRE family transcriptional regulator [Tsuneonella mangrovi]
MMDQAAPCQGVQFAQVEMTDFDKKLVEAVKGKMGREGLSVRALSKIVGVSFSTLARINRGEGSPDNNTKIRLLEWLGPDAHDEGLEFEEVAFVHFRAAKGTSSQTVQTLLSAAACLREQYRENEPNFSEEDEFDDPVELSKEELERIAEDFRSDLGLDDQSALNSLGLRVAGVTVEFLTQSECLSRPERQRLSGASSAEWSAMSVPLNSAQDRWVVLLNDTHTVERQRVTLLEEYWHILLGHKLVKIAKIAGAYGRTYDTAEEHDAYFLASASLLPREAVRTMVQQKAAAAEIAAHFGTSTQLVEYRIKRLGLWRDYKGKSVELS